jgi:hypothetical protein
MTADPRTEHLNDADAEPMPAARGGAAGERRRPGRLERVSPALIALLRSDARADLPRDEDREAGTTLAPMQGILLAAVVGLLMWTGLFWLARELL